MAPIVAFIPLIAAGIAAATTGYAIANQPGPAPKAPAPVQTATSVGNSQQIAAQAQAMALTRRRGMASTILTSPMGTPSGASTQTSTLGIG